MSAAVGRLASLGAGLRLRRSRTDSRFLARVGRSSAAAFGRASPSGYTRAMSCLFCRIVAGEIPSKRVYEDDQLLAFEDVKPEAPLHVLVVPKRHIASLNDLQDGDDALTGALLRRAAIIAKERGYDASGFRAVVNTNRDAGQTVFHIHLHLLAGRRLAWPPG